MKRTFIYIASLLVLLAAVAPKQPVHAENTMFTTTRLNDWASTAIKYGEAFGFNLAGLIMPSYKTDKQTAIFNYEPYSITAAKFGDRSLPGTLRPNGRIKDWDADHEVERQARYGAILKARAEHGDDVISDECYISEDNQVSAPLNFVRPLWQHGYVLDAIYGLQSILPSDDGVFDMNREELHLAGMNGAEDCKKHFRGTEDEPVENDQVQLSHFGNSPIEAFMRETIFTIIEKIIKLADGSTQVTQERDYERENAHQQVILTKKERQPYQESNCDFSVKPCAGNQVGPVYSKDLDKHGGFPAGFIADSMQVDVEAHALLWDNVTLIGFPAGKVEDFDLNANKMKHGFNTMACTGVPSELQDKAIIGDKDAYQKIQEYCDPKNITPGVTLIPPNETITSSTVVGASQCTPDGGVGQSGGNMIQAISAAATKASIPLCALDGVARIEGAYTGGACSPNECSAMGPFQITVGYTYTNQNGSCQKDTSCSQCGSLSRCPNAIDGYLQGVAKTLGHQVDPCNANDAAFAAASMLKGKAAYFDADLTGTNTDVTGDNEAMLTAIIYAGNSYYGSSQAFSSGSNIVPGCSYGESIVKKYCGITSYVCGTLNRPVNQGPPSNSI